MATVITHIFNESYLLPMWLRHHRELFDHGIVIDYNSTDGPREIMAELVPTWEYRNTHLDHFDAIVLDQVVNSIESQVSGPRIVLTVTEFLLGQPRRADRQYFIPQVMLVNMDDSIVFNENRPFHHQVSWGIGSDTECIAPWWSRSLHIEPTRYGEDGSMTGRHYQKIDNGTFLIYRVSNCFVSEQMYERRLQIQHRIPQADKDRNMGVQHHNWNNGLTKEDLMAQQINFRAEAKDLSELLHRYGTTR